MLRVKIKLVLINSLDQLGVKRMVFQKTLRGNENLTLVGNFVPLHLDILPPPEYTNINSVTCTAARKAGKLPELIE